MSHEDVLFYVQVFAYSCGGLASIGAFFAVGLPAIGKYPAVLQKRLKANLGDLFTGDMRDDMKSQALELRADMARQAQSHTRAIHELAEIVADNRTEDQMALHAHISAPGLHLTPEANT